MYPDKNFFSLPQGVELVILRDARNTQPEKPSATGKIPMAKAYAIGVKFTEDVDGAMFAYTVEKFGDKVAGLTGRDGVFTTIVCISADGEPSGYPENGMRLAHVKAESEDDVKVDIYQIGIVNHMGNLHVAIDKTYSDVIFFKDDKGNVVCDEFRGPKWETLRTWFAGIFAEHGIKLSKRPYKRKDKVVITSPQNPGEMRIIFHNLLMGYAYAKARTDKGNEVTVIIPKAEMPVVDPKKPVALKPGTLCSFKYLVRPEEKSRANCDFVAKGVLIGGAKPKPEAKPVVKKPQGNGKTNNPEPNGKTIFGKLSEKMFGKK